MSVEQAVQSRIAVVVRDDLASWQRLNVVAFLSSAIVASHPESLGEPYRDGRGREFPRMFAQPVMVFEAAGEDLARIAEGALAADLHAMPFPEVLFTTGNDADNRAAFAALESPARNPAGLVLHGGRNRISKLLARAHKHP